MACPHWRLFNMAVNHRLLRREAQAHAPREFAANATLLAGALRDRQRGDIVGAQLKFMQLRDNATGVFGHFRKAFARESAGLYKMHMRSIAKDLESEAEAMLGRESVTLHDLNEITMLLLDSFDFYIAARSRLDALRVLTHASHCAEISEDETLRRWVREGFGRAHVGATGGLPQ